ncbi:hypothetical protein Tco_1455672 [Tanacetum coccineum]
MPYFGIHLFARIGEVGGFRFGVALVVVGPWSAKRAFFMRANEKTSPKVVGFDLKSARCRAGKPIIMSTPKFAETYNLVAFLEKPKESNGQFWETAKAKTVNKEHQIQALVDKKKVIITEKSVRSDLMLEDAEGTECLPNDVIFEQLTLIGAKTSAWNEFSSTMASSIISPKDMGEDSAAPTDSHSTPIITQPSSSKPQKKKSRRKQRKDSVPTKLIRCKRLLMKNLYLPLPVIHLKVHVLDLEEAKTAQAKEIGHFKEIVKQIWKREESRRTHGSRGRKLVKISRIESSNDVSLGAQEDASKQGRKIDDPDADAEVTLIDETQERYDDEMLFDIQDDLQGGRSLLQKKEVAEKKVSVANLVTTAGEVVTTSSATTTVDELTLAQTLIEIKAAKPKAVTTAATTITTAVASTRPKAKGIVFHDQEEQASAFTPIVSSSQLPQAKDKGKGKIVEPEKPLKKKDQIALDEELALRLHAEKQAELEKERVA